MHTYFESFHYHSISSFSFFSKLSLTENRECTNCSRVSKPKNKISILGSTKPSLKRYKWFKESLQITLVWNAVHYSIPLILSNIHYIKGNVENAYFSTPTVDIKKYLLHKKYGRLPSYKASVSSCNSNCKSTSEMHRSAKQ